MFGFNTQLAEICLPVPAIVPNNYTGAAANGGYVSLKNFNSIAFLIETGAWAAGTAAVTVYQAQDVSGTGRKQLTLSKPTLYTNTNLVGALTAAAIASNTFNLAAANTLYIFEVPARSLDAANGFDCLRLEVATPGVNNDYYGALYLLRQPSYAQLGTSLPDPLVD